MPRVHVVPVQPLAHVHVKPSTESTQTPPLLHGVLAHSLSFIEQRAPEYPAVQVHVKPSTESTHVAPLWQGVLEHSLT